MFERFFDASIGKAIRGAQKIVSGSYDAFLKAFNGARNVASGFGGGFQGTTAAVAAKIAAMAASFAKFASKYGGQAFQNVIQSVGGRFRSWQKRNARWNKKSQAWRDRAWKRLMLKRTKRVRRFVDNPMIQGLANSRFGAQGFSGGLKLAVALAQIPVVGEAMAALTIMAAAGISAFKRLHQVAEEHMEENRRLAPYSGQLAGAFTRLELGDMFRALKLARSAEVTGSVLVDQVNMIRQAMAPMDRLALGIGNRVGIGAAGMFEPTAMLFGGLSRMFHEKLEAFDPGGAGSKAFGESIGDSILGGMEGLVKAIMGPLALIPGMAPDFKAIAEKEREAAKKEMMEESEMWTKLMLNARSLPVLPVAKPVKP